LHDKFGGAVNCKTNSSSLIYETVNLGTRDNPQNINLGKGVPSKKNPLLLNYLRNLKTFFLGCMMT
jgi:hypothetical protein